jgi:hypothetical protein
VDSPLKGRPSRRVPTRGTPESGMTFSSNRYAAPADGCCEALIAKRPSRVSLGNGQKTDNTADIFQKRYRKARTFCLIL